jgi:hypothetical protein
MPAEDFAFWQEYFNIYPFTQDREDERTALLATVITNMSGKVLKREIKMSAFMPSYLPHEKPIADPLQRDVYRKWDESLKNTKGA